MRTVSTPPRRKSVINVFSTPPLRCSVLSRSTQRALQSGEPPFPSPFRDQSPQKSALYPSSATDSNDDDDDDENMLTATGDISMSYPYYVPGVAGALSPKPPSRRGTPNLKAGLARMAPPQRPRPPVRRLVSVGAGTYKFRTLTAKGGPDSNTSRASTNPSMYTAETTRAPNATPAPSVHPGDTLVSSTSSCDSSIGSIDDKDLQMSTPQSRFAAFMKSRDLTQSPKKKAADSVAECNRRLDALAQEAKEAGVGREAAHLPSRPLRGYAPLPLRMPIPDWRGMDVDNL
ncbi:hypothetical protein C8R44DRAFT_980521 [Mycena epipterygia]|nr:hypothetical protein C8R44DRAFT_980521 [Mycena epipterygia]